MSNRKEFIQWLKQNNSGLSAIEIESKIYFYDVLNIRYKLYSVEDIGKIQNIGEKEEIGDYLRFLEASGKIGPQISPENIENGIEDCYRNEDYDKDELRNISETISVNLDGVDRTILDNDYEKKKKAQKIIKKRSSRYLEEQYNLATSGICAKLTDDNHVETKECSSNAVIVFSIVEGRYSDLANENYNIPMASYVSYDVDGGEKMFLRNDSAFYYPVFPPTQHSSANAFSVSFADPDVLRRALKDTLDTIHGLSPMYGTLCLVPDNLGDFKDSIKGQIKAAQSSIVQIPRSVAAAYAFTKIYDIDKDVSFACYDYDTSEMCCTEIRIHPTEDGKYEYTRMKRRRYKNQDAQAFDSIAHTYINKYKEKYGIDVSAGIEDTLVKTRDILSVLKDGNSLVFENESGYSEIGYDEQIIEDIVQMMDEEVNANPIGTDYLCILSDIKTEENGFFKFEDLCYGCVDILERIINHEVIWREYLPELSLDVIKNQTFDTLQLIKPSMFQNISEASMDEDVELPLDDGQFIIPANLLKVFCPLKREEFGNTQRDKMAVFEMETAFQESTEVKLKLTYHYGDPDSYKLIAESLDGTFSLESHWADSEMENTKYPEYTPQSVGSLDGWYDLSNAIDEFINELSKPWIYSATGGRAHGAPFNGTPSGQYQWYGFRPIAGARIRYAFPYIFAPNNFAAMNDAQKNKCKQFIAALLWLFTSCEKNALKCRGSNEECTLSAVQLAAIQREALEYLSLCGGILCTKGFIDDNLLQNIVSLSGRAVYRGKSNDSNLRSSTIALLQLSTHVKRDQDRFGIWQLVDERLNSSINNSMVRTTIVRTIASVCWRNADWVYQFYNVGEAVVNSLIEHAFNLSVQEWNWHQEHIYSEFNPRTIRDAFEALLGLTRLKKLQPNILDCNASITKDIVLLAKEIDHGMRDSGNMLSHPFVSRIQVDVPEELAKVSSVV